MAEYKIKDLETLTGIKAHTIRIWEKRYGLISPNRTDTQIRSYNDDELALLLNVSLLNKNGLKISHIAEMKPEQIAEKVWELKVNKSVDSSTEKLILALIELDEDLFKSTIQNLIENDGLELTFINTIIPFLDRIGVMYLVGSINPAQEHFISNLIRQKVIAEIDKLPNPSTEDKPIMLFLPEHEWHEIGLLFYQFILRNKGIKTIYLGQSLPLDSLKECVKKIKPKALVTSWLTSVDESFITGYFKNLKAIMNITPIYAGGYQIGLHSELIKDFVVEFKDCSVLLKEISLS
jgi:DNA-binding transcriptional MerR regulator